MKKLLLICIVSWGFTLTLHGQSQDKADLEKERKEIQDELKQIQSLYDNVKGQTKQSLSQLNVLKRKMNLRERYINSINKELRMIDDEIYRNNLEIFRLRRQLDTLKAEYARTIVYAYKNRSSFNFVNFIFSASSFNDAIRRITYLKSYRSYREKQVATIYETQDLIAYRQQQQTERKQLKNETLVGQTKQRNELAEQRKEKDAVVSKLKSQEKDLQKEITAKKKRDRDLQNAITAIIRREIEAARKSEQARVDAAKKAEGATSSVTKPAASSATKPADRPESYLELNAKDIALGTDFSDNRGRLPWPVDKGFVKVPFGTYSIEGTKIKGDNPGVTIGTEKGSSVKAVFDGVVSAVHNYGDGALIVVRHGKYFTSYSNLSSVSVGKGATVRRGQVIGKAGESDDNAGGQVDFMLMIESNNVNPAPWLIRH